MTSENIAALQDNFFMCHPHAGLLLSHTGNLSLNTAAMNLFGAYQLSPYQNILSHLLHPEDCQQLHTLLAAHLSTDHTPPTNHSYLWRWFVNHDQMSTIKSHVSYNEHGCCVVLEPASQTLANQHNPEIGNNFSEYKSLPNTLNTLDDGADVDAAALEDIIDLWKYLNKD